MKSQSAVTTSEALSEAGYAGEGEIYVDGELTGRRT
jgi:hypothetical protein